jgi:ATP-dependent Lhr-like helicase
VAERFFDETGGMQLVLHAPFGARINKAWGLALRKRFCRGFDFELQAAATDDGINLSLGPQHSFPIEDLFQFLRAHKIEDALVQAVLASPLFTVRWRWTLTRSLALLRFAGGRRVPAPIQRMRSDDLLAAIFPAQAQCQDNRMTADVPVPDHPLVFEALRDCLYEALDMEGLRKILKKIESGKIEFSGRDTPMPSVFSHQILNAMPYAFLDGAPLEERRARAVLLRRALPERADELGKLDPDAIRGAAEDAWPMARNQDELHDALLGFIVFPESEFDRLSQDAWEWMNLLAEDGRAFRIEKKGRRYWAAEELRKLVTQLFSPSSTGDGNPLLAVIRGWVEVSGPVTAKKLAATLGFDQAEVNSSLIHLEGEGIVLRGYFSQTKEEEFCDRRILARIHRATIVHLRREIEPVPAATFLRYLLEWQHVAAGSQLSGEQGTLEAIDQLQGFETAAAAWEEEILRARVADYKPEFLDSLCLGGEVVWGRWTRRETQAEVPSRRPGLTRIAPLGLGIREDLPCLIDSEPANEKAISSAAGDVLAFLRRRGASFFHEMVAGSRRLPAEVEEALWQLVAAGFATADSYAALRALVSGETKRIERSRRRRRTPRRTREGRWSLIEMFKAEAENRVEFWANQYVRRYGIFCRELLARESSAPPWRELLQVLRRSEARGEIRGGRFIAGLNGEQFGLPEAVDALRALRRKEASGQYLKISACDPLNLVGILTPGARVQSVMGNRIVYRDGIPVASLENGLIRWLTPADDSEQRIICRLLDERNQQRREFSSVL